MIQSILIYIVSVKLTWITCSHRETTFMGSYIRKYLQLFQTGLMSNVYDNRNTLVAQHWIESHQHGNHIDAPWDDIKQ